MVASNSFVPPDPRSSRRWFFFGGLFGGGFPVLWAAGNKSIKDDKKHEDKKE